MLLFNSKALLAYRQDVSSTVASSTSTSTSTIPCPQITA